MAEGKGAHVVLTGPISGRIPIDNPAFADGVVDVTEGVLHVDSVEQAQAVAHAIEVAHVTRGTHPVQQAERALKADAQAVAKGAAKRFHDDVRAGHEQQKADLAKRVGLKVEEI